MPMSMPTNFQRENTYGFRDTVSYVNTVHLTFAEKKGNPIIDGLYLLNRSADLPEILHACPWNIYLSGRKISFWYFGLMRRYRIFIEFILRFRAIKRSSAYNSWTVGPIGLRFGTDTFKNTTCPRKKFQPSTPSYRRVTRRLLLCAFIISIFEQQRVTRVLPPWIICATRRHTYADSKFYCRASSLLVRYSCDRYWTMLFRSPWSMIKEIDRKINIEEASGRTVVEACRSPRIRWKLCQEYSSSTACGRL